MIDIRTQVSAREDGARCPAVSREGAISAAHVRLAMAMYTMCDYVGWPYGGGGDGDGEHEKDLAVAGVAKIAMVVRYLWSVSGRAIRDLGTESIKWVPTAVA
jgi:hypothetical protein